jgi:serine/threonine protein phosphatase 1
MIAIGDYLFVHAGIDPRVPIEEQKVHDLRWIREPFLSHAEDHGQVVVHGHTITDEPEDCGNRIGIDTGAFMTGRLTALVLEGTQRRYLEAVESEDGRIAVAPLVA